MTVRGSYPAIGDYALIGDGHSVALVSRRGSIDWCCLPRIDHGACFARLLDWGRGGFFSVTPANRAHVSRRYLEGTLVLETTFRTGTGEARMLDCLTLNVDDPDAPYAQILRVLVGVHGEVELRASVAARFDYGDLRPWRRRHGQRVFSLTGGDDGLVLQSDLDFAEDGRHDLAASVTLRPEERRRLSLTFTPPHLIDRHPPHPLPARELDRRLESTIAGWRGWSRQVQLDGPDRPAVVRSAIVLKALANPTTGAIAAAATTSLPESPGGELNWDYRYSWIRDSVLSVRSLAEVGCETEADDFRRFVERSAAGAVEDLQIMYGVGGERHLAELTLEHLEGYRGARPVRVGNAAFGQRQLDVYGELVELAWRWHQRGHRLDDDYWQFVVQLVEAAAVHWPKPDQGIWEVRGRPLHFVHSKVMCWAALDRGIGLAAALGRGGRVRRWRVERAAVRRAIERHGYDWERGVFVQAFDEAPLDAAALLLPQFGFVDWSDERMLRTTDAIRTDLDQDGLLLRYRTPRGIPGREGAFLACSFWLAECLAHQHRLDEAREVFERAASTANDLGLFAEEYDTRAAEALGNFPQGFTHLAHIGAAVALAEREAAGRETAWARTG